MNQNLNPVQVQTDITNLKNSFVHVANTFYEAGKNLFSVLIQDWCSQKASDFSFEYSSKLYTNTVDVFVKASTSIANSCVDVYNNNIGSQAGTLLGKYTDPPTTVQPSFGALKSSGPQGEIGMNTPHIENALIIYKRYLDTANATIDSIIGKAYLYDPNGSLKSNLENTITKLKDRVNSTVNPMIKSLEDAMQIEPQVFISAPKQ